MSSIYLQLTHPFLISLYIDGLNRINSPSGILMRSSRRDENNESEDDSAKLTNGDNMYIIEYEEFDLDRARNQENRGSLNFISPTNRALSQEG